MSDHVGTTKYVCSKCGYWMRMSAPSGHGASGATFPSWAWHEAITNPDGTVVCDGGQMVEVLEEMEL